MKNYPTFEQSKKLHEKNIIFGEPVFGDLFYTVHPDTNQIDTVIVGSAKWHISALLQMYRAPSLKDLIELLADEYAIRFEKTTNEWVLEKTTLLDFTSNEYDYLIKSHPVSRNKCPFDLIIDFIFATGKFAGL